MQKLHRKCVLVPADKAANNVVVVCRHYYIKKFKHKLDGTRAYQETDSDGLTSYLLSFTSYLLSFLFVSMKAKKNFLRCPYVNLSFTKDSIKLDLLQILFLVLPLTEADRGHSKSLKV